jgi:hypothetical protein
VGGAATRGAPIGCAFGYVLWSRVSVSLRLPVLFEFQLGVRGNVRSLANLAGVHMAIRVMRMAIEFAQRLFRATVLAGFATVSCHVRTSSRSPCFSQAPGTGDGGATWPSPSACRSSRYAFRLSAIFFLSG